MLRIGLTGGIASGKSAVAAMLRDMGIPVVDADAVAHALMEPGQAAHREILSEFGGDVADEQGFINRGKLARMVFADSAKLARLNAILHPRVEEETFRQFAAWEREGKDLAFVEAALLVEAGIYRKLDGVVVAWSTPEQQLLRLRERGMSEEQARSRLAVQMPVPEKLQFATERIDCSGTLAETRAQVRGLAAKLRAATSKSMGSRTSLE
jgi:dephospho-CoA kinase